MKTFELPISGIKVALKNRITLRMQEDLTLAEYQFDDGEKKNRIVNLQKGVQYRKREAIVMLVDSAKDKEGKDVTVDHQWLQDLDIEDFLSLQEEVDAIYKKKVDFLTKRDLQSDLR